MSSSAPTHWSAFAPILSSCFDAALSGYTSDFFYTFHHTAQNVSSRIDHIFAHFRFQSYTCNTTLTPTPFSDHVALTVSFTPASFIPPLLRRVNSQVLDHSRLRTQLDDLLPTDIDGLSWNVCKVLLRSTALDY